ncbi:MAG: hypothetical protein LQ343_005374 [Gyalolechia ehrenbergii]|nr:MAG: hypothetical protein LQ343_005374 [Gyalolechia ehrenbergii]
MSADRVTPSTPTKESHMVHVTPSRSAVSTKVSPEGDTMPPLEGTPSRVTINVRDSALEVSHLTSTAPTIQSCDDHDSEKDELANVSHLESSKKLTPNSPDIGSASSSPSRSPEIEVAEVEDINQEPGNTRWRPLGSRPDPAKIRDDLWAMFPCRDRAQSVLETSDEITRHFQRQQIEDGALFRSLADWIRLYLSKTEPYSSEWSNLYANEHGFWLHFIGIVNALCKRGASRNATVLPLPLRYNDSKEDHEAFEDLLTSFAALTFRMVDIDCQTFQSLASEDSEQPEFVSFGYLEWLYSVASATKSALWRNLHHIYSYNSAATVSLIVREVCQPSFNGFDLLSRLLHQMLLHARIVPHIIDKIGVIFEILHRTLDHHYLLRRDSSGAENENTPSCEDLIFKAHSFFQVVNSILQTFISKQVAVLSHDLCATVLCHLAALLHKLTTVDENLAKRVLSEDLGLVNTFSTAAAPVIAEEAWKFQIFRKCFLEGRMEIRIQGVESMQLELVDMHHKYMQGPNTGRQHPVVPFLCDFIVDNKVIDYLVGVESHPRLIRLTGNIVGFLVVNHRYTEAESDKIWDTVTKSQDPGVVGAVLQMLPSIFNISNYSLLLYLVRKLDDISLSAWDPRVTLYAEQLLGQTVTKWKDLRRGFGMDEAPYQCCIRLIREASTCESSTLTKRRTISGFASRTLENLLEVGPLDKDRFQIYQDCIGDIAGGTKCATGSICVINILLRHDARIDIRTLAQQFGITDLVIAEFEQTISRMSQGLLEPRYFDECLAARLDLLQNIIIHNPDSISTERGWSLWEAMVGSNAPSDFARESALIMLVHATVSVRRHNSFIDACISEYLPKLPPRFYTGNILYFVSHVCQYGNFVDKIGDHADTSYSDRPGIDMLWRIALVAPSNTVERQAIEALVSAYVVTPKNQGMPKATVERIHVEVVDRCVRQLNTAASRLKAFTDGTSSGEDEPMVVVASDEEIHLQRLSFCRSLLVLKELFHRVRSHPAYSPVPSAHSQQNNDVEEINGAPVTVRYQPFSGASNRSIKTLQIGDLEKVRDLMQRFGTLTGFPEFTVIVGGQKVSLDECSDLTLRTTRLHEKGLFLIKNLPSGETAPKQSSLRGLKPLDLEIMGHFSDFYRFLSLDEALSKEVLEFLRAFPPDDHVVSLVYSDSSPIKHVFPFATPFKALYSVYAFEQCLNSALLNGSPTQGFICHGIQVISKSLRNAPVSGASSTTDGELRAVAGLIECLLKFLKGEQGSMSDHVSNTNVIAISEATRTEASSKLLSEQASLVEGLLCLINIAEHTEDLSLVLSLTCGSLGCILEASLHSKVFFKAFQDANQFQIILRKVLLCEPRRVIRVGIAKSIKSICDHPGLDSSQKHEFASFCWINLETLIPESLQYGSHAEEFCGVATTVLRSLDDTRRQNLDLSAYTEDWCNLLLKHQHTEFVGRDSLDWVIHGISDLVLWCIQFIKSTKKPMNIDGNLIESLLRAHLFPLISEPALDAPLQPALPVLHSKTRQNLYNILLAFGNSTADYHKLLRIVRSLLPQDEGPQAWSWGVAQTSEGLSYDVNWNFERSNAIRSSTGYPGLKNLTNTCYMNSLLTQLFMNVRFRDFMLSTHITDQNHSQRLLAETKTLFAYMQETMLKAVDTQGVADSLINYENTLIDVTVQMDVDEFYNLLFDRWESQILSDTGKKSFRAFYGGQIVQQIKSKECPHVSERLEPFSAIQCDIQGKSSLSESLSAYVGGEIMEGDNKYSCTSCGSYVDAVKRACFREIPNNLIFHLKRFDYDIMTGVRHKINDRFEFPEKIDMSPYNINYLQDTDHPPSPDVFELVGILVHMGTAESGHYYSYIRERSPRAEQDTTWVEFNDADVTPFDPSRIPDFCFGGITEPAGYAAASYSKSWNAYMLFYQRLPAAGSDLQQTQPIAEQQLSLDPLSSDLGKRITVDNEKFLRNCCLYDSAHASFAIALLDQLRVVTKSCCSDEHAVEKDAIVLSLEYADQVLSRMKDSTDFEKMLESLTAVIRGCSVCCRLALEWTANNKIAFRNLLLRCPTAKVRKSFGDILVRALKYLRDNDPQEYGFDVNSIEIKSGNAVLPESTSRVFQRIVENIRELWPILHLHSRSWDDYFGLLATIAGFGIPETFVLLREDFLKLCIEILIIDSTGARRLRVDSPHYNQLLRLIEKGRKYSLANLIQLLQALLLRIDLEVRPFEPKYHDRLQLESGLFPLSIVEESYIYYRTDPSRSRSLVFLEKIISAKSNPTAVKKILQMMILAEPQVGHLPDISKTILNGISIDPADQAEPHLVAALTFCETSNSPQAVREMITQVAREVDTIGTSGGAAHLDFFVQARQLVNPRISRRTFNKWILRTVSMWGPPLLMYYDEPIRQATVEFLKILIFHHGSQSTEGREENEELGDYARGLCEACIKRVQDNVIQQQHQVDIKSVEIIREVIRHCIVTYFQTGTAEDDRIAEEAEGNVCRWNESGERWR